MKNKISIDSSLYKSSFKKNNKKKILTEEEKKEVMKDYNENFKDDIEKIRKENLNGIK
jgi:uncharacterized protein YaiI (UPF0178 family)